MFLKWRTYEQKWAQLSEILRSHTLTDFNQALGKFMIWENKMSNTHTEQKKKKNKKRSCVMTLNSSSNVVLGIVIYTAGKFHIRNPSPLRILSPTLFPHQKNP